jgi:hypothetical protein
LRLRSAAASGHRSLWLDSILAFHSETTPGFADPFEIAALNEICDVTPHLMDVGRPPAVNGRLDVLLCERNELSDIGINVLIVRAASGAVVGFKNRHFPFLHVGSNLPRRLSRYITSQC